MTAPDSPAAAGTDPGFVMRVLAVIAEADAHGDLFWRRDGSMFILCNDVFWWGTADCEALLTPADLDALERALADAKAASGDDSDGPTLYCARRRRMRPQGAVYKHLDRHCWPLFDACGPERDTGVGNPHPHPGAATP